jgi:hypothetical protein
MTLAEIINEVFEEYATDYGGKQYMNLHEFNKAVIKIIERIR